MGGVNDLAGIPILKRSLGPSRAQLHDEGEGGAPKKEDSSHDVLAALLSLALLSLTTGWKEEEESNKEGWIMG